MGDQTETCQGLHSHSGRRRCGESCSSGQCFVFGFLQIQLHRRQTCRSANRSPCRAGRGLAPRSHPDSTTVTGTVAVEALRAMPGAAQENHRFGWPLCELVETATITLLYKTIAYNAERQKCPLNTLRSISVMLGQIQTDFIALVAPAMRRVPQCVATPDQSAPDSATSLPLPES